jgi:hypothetical protein
VPNMQTLPTTAGAPLIPIGVLGLNRNSDGYVAEGECADRVHPDYGSGVRDALRRAGLGQRQAPLACAARVSRGTR